MLGTPVLGRNGEQRVPSACYIAKAVSSGFGGRPYLKSAATNTTTTRTSYVGELINRSEVKVWPHLPQQGMSPNPSQVVPFPDDQAFKYTNLRGPFLFKPPQSTPGPP